MWGKAPWQHGRWTWTRTCIADCRCVGKEPSMPSWPSLVSVWPLLPRPIRPSAQACFASACITTPMVAGFGSGYRPSVRVSQPLHVLEPSHDSPQNLLQIHLGYSPLIEHHGAFTTPPLWTNMADTGGESNIPAIPGHDPKSSADYIQFKCLPPGGPLNRWSTTLTREHDFPGAQVCNCRTHANVLADFALRPCCTALVFPMKRP